MLPKLGEQIEYDLALLQKLVRNYFHITMKQTTYTLGCYKPASC